MPPLPHHSITRPLFSVISKRTSFHLAASAAEMSTVCRVSPSLKVGQYSWISILFRVRVPAGARRQAEQQARVGRRRRGGCKERSTAALQLASAQRTQLIHQHPLPQLALRFQNASSCPQPTHRSCRSRACSCPPSPQWTAGGSQWRRTPTAGGSPAPGWWCTQSRWQWGWTRPAGRTHSRKQVGNAASRPQAGKSAHDQQVQECLNPNKTPIAVPCLPAQQQPTCPGKLNSAPAARW